jgi:hypothetical protein
LRKLPDLKTYRALMNAQKLLAAHARQIATDDLAHETRLRSTLNDKEAKLEASLADWSFCLNSQRPDPQQLQRMAASVAHLDAERTKLAGDVEAAAAVTEAALLRVATTEAQVRVSRDVLKDSRRTVAKSRDEAAARSLEDRIAFVWRPT